jgi:hypothetical protein
MDTTELISTRHDRLSFALRYSKGLSLMLRIFYNQKGSIALSIWILHKQKGSIACPLLACTRAAAVSNDNSDRVDNDDDAQNVGNGVNGDSLESSAVTCLCDGGNSGGVGVGA